MSLILSGTGGLTIPSGSVLSASPATGDRSTAIATMQKFADEFSANLAGNGWQKFPNGLIIQWGQGAASSSVNTSVNINFPTAYTAQVLCVSVTRTSTNIATDINSFAVGAISSLTSFPIKCQLASATFFWMALGY
jgi:hypothetical protein